MIKRTNPSWMILFEGILSLVSPVGRVKSIPVIVTDAKRSPICIPEYPMLAKYIAQKNPSEFKLNLYELIKVVRSGSCFFIVSKE